MTVARHYERHLKEFGQPNGPLGYVALAILEALVEDNFDSGRLTYSFLNERTKMSNSAISRAFKNLCEHGFLEKSDKERSVYKLLLPDLAVEIFTQYQNILLQPFMISLKYDTNGSTYLRDIWGMCFMKKITIILGLLGAVTLAACGDAKLNAYEFKQAANETCDKANSRKDLQKYEECFLGYYADNMEKNVERNELAKAENDRRVVYQNYKRNQRTRGLPVKF